MSQPDVELVRRTAALARLELTPAEEPRFAAQFARILDAFRELAELDVAGVEDMTGPVAFADNVLRADEPRPSLPTEELLARAPAREGAFYSVPKLVGGAADGEAPEE
jgi:aspartyl-tRNA(Asn)/glutamyl-tRNA(Gln) amidotransferase subunit C